MNADPNFALYRELRAIEERRIELSVTRTELERLAGLASGYYSKLIAGRHSPRPGLISRFRIILKRLAAKQDGSSDADFRLSMVYSMAIALVAMVNHQDAVAIQQQVPSRRATQSAEWMAAVETRRIALYLLNTAAGFSQAEVARAARVTRQAVHIACREIEERRNEASFDRLLDDLTRSITGDW